MKKLLLALLLVLFLPLTAPAQQNGGASNVGIGAPTGSCNSTQLYVDSGTGFLYTCKAGAWFNQGSTAGTINFPATVGGTVNSGGIPYFNSTTQMSSSAALASGGVVLGGGAGSAPSTNTALTFSATTLAVGAAGVGNGVIGLNGTTSGQATITAPAVAGTAGNAVVFSNAIQSSNSLTAGTGIAGGQANAIQITGREGFRDPSGGIFQITNNANNQNFQFKAIGAPTCASTGTGSTGTCTVGTNSQDSVMLLTLTPGGTGIAATGVLTITYNATVAFSSGHQADPICTLYNGTGTWNARASFIGQTHSQTAPTANWDNNAVALTSGSTYQLACHAAGI